MAERLRGRRAVAQRLRRLQAEPLCRDCASAGIVRGATVPDHIVPLAHGGSDEEKISDASAPIVTGPARPSSSGSAERSALRQTGGRRSDRTPGGGSQHHPVGESNRAWSKLYVTAS